MRKQIKDERIVLEAHKQNSVAFAILYFGLLLDLLYRQFILKDPLSRYWDLALLYFGVTFYLAGKRVFSGIFTTKVKVILTIPASIFATVVFGIVNYVWLNNKSPMELTVACVVFFCVFYGLNLLMQYLSYKKNNDMLKED